MNWVAPSEKDSATDTLEKRLWAAADQFRANSGLSAAQYSQPVLGLIFLRFAEARFSKQRALLEKASASSRRGSRVEEPGAYHAEGILYLAPSARFDFLLNLPEAADIGAKVNDAMREIEKQNPQLAGVLPKTYNLFTSTLLKELLKKASEKPVTSGGTATLEILERQNWPEQLETIHWQEGAVLVLDNWRVLHGRGRSDCSDSDRKLLRISIP
jgi:type I restriction enzyme M protein